MAMKNNPSNENTLPINFHPMPKRFMVWDKFEHRFHRIRSEKGSWQYVFDIWEMQLLLERLDLTENVICQSTNLFDVRGIEIFEGSIIRDEDEGYFSVIEYRDGEYYGVDPYTTEIIDSLSAMKLCSEVIGHILSDPELVEDGNG